MQKYNPKHFCSQKEHPRLSNRFRSHTCWGKGNFLVPWKYETNISIKKCIKNRQKSKYQWVTLRKYLKSIFLSKIRFSLGFYQARHTLLDVISRLTTSVRLVRAPIKSWETCYMYYVKLFSGLIKVYKPFDYLIK